MTSAQIVETLLDEGNGTLLASDAARAGIARSTLSRMAERGVIERAERGVYVRPDVFDDEMYALQKRARKIVFSHETALFLHDLTDRTPLRHAITVPTGYKASPALKKRCKIYYIAPDLIELGQMRLPSHMGHDVLSYDAERTICDVVRSRNRMDQQIVTDALKNYARGRGNLNRLAAYSKKFGIRRILFRYLEVLL